jgi:hypothetical protein
MGHKAGPEFFDRKREWSERKDRVLSSYLPPYVQKVAHGLRRPVCVVDGFAGPGQFKDGKPGSPLIIRRTLEEAAKRPGVRVEAMCVESDDALYAELAGRMRGMSWIRTRHGKFLDQVDEIEALAATHSVFLYLDPYTVDGLEWAALDRLFKKIEEGVSVEVLLNFNADSFARRGLAALTMAPPPIPPDDDDPDVEIPTGAEAPTLAGLDAIAGGDWWRPLLQGTEAYPVKVRRLMDGLSARLRRRFSRVCAHNIYARASDRLPKYALIFGSRSQAALFLMNDAMVAAREMLAEASDPGGAVLFDNRTEEVVPDRARLTRLVQEAAVTRRKRVDLIEAVLRSWVGAWEYKVVRGEVERQLKDGMLRSETGRTRTNDETAIWKP